MRTAAARSSLLAVLIGSAALALTLVVAVPAARSAADAPCRLSSGDQQPASGRPTYNLKLTARGTSCATARRVMRAFHRCRAKAATGCATRVLARWTCHGRRDSSTPLMFYGRFTCIAGRAAVKSVYQQNT